MGFGAAMCLLPLRILLWSSLVLCNSVPAAHSGVAASRFLGAAYACKVLWCFATQYCSCVRSSIVLCNCKWRWSGRWWLSFSIPQQNIPKLSKWFPFFFGAEIRFGSWKFCLSVCVCVRCRCFCYFHSGQSDFSAKVTCEYFWILMMCICALLRFCFAIHWLLRAVKLLCQGAIAIHVCVCVSEMSKQRDEC